MNSINIELAATADGNRIKVLANGHTLALSSFLVHFTGNELEFLGAVPKTDHNGQRIGEHEVNILNYLDPLYCNFQLVEDVRKGIQWDLENIWMTSLHNAKRIYEKEEKKCISELNA